MKLMHFTAEWCQPCKMMKPIISDVIADNPDIEYQAVDIDSDRETAMNFEIMSVPTFILIGDNGEKISQVSGAMMRGPFEQALGI